MEVLPFRGKACWQTNHSSDSSYINSLSIEDCIKATIIMSITIAVISLNALMILVLHSKNYSRYLRDLPRILMTSLSLTDLAVGTLVTPISFISIINQCWPWSQMVCAIEALLISALFHESTLSLLCIAIDRYICIVHPLRYHSLMTKKVFISLFVLKVNVFKTRTSISFFKVFCWHLFSYHYFFSNITENVIVFNKRLFYLLIIDFISLFYLLINWWKRWLNIWLNCLILSLNCLA